MVGLNSPFGLLGQIKDKRGYTHGYVMWKQPWMMYIIEMADMPRYDEKADVPVFDNVTEIKRHLGTN